SANVVPLLYSKVSLCCLLFNNLRHFLLLVDIAAGRLVDTASSQSFPIVSESSAAGGRCANIAPPFQELLQKFPEVVNPDKRLPPVTKHNVEHHIRVKDGPP
ncbi:MAG: hypothetical protein ACK55Z_01740, partial [bacterium]